MKMERTKCSETSAYKIQTPENYPEESIHYLIVILSQLTGITLECIKISHDVFSIFLSDLSFTVTLSYILGTRLQQLIQHVLLTP